MAPNEKVPFHEKLGLRSKTQSKSHVVDRESPVFEEKMKERAFCPWRIGLRCFVRSTFEEIVFQQNKFSENVTFLDCVGGCFWTFPKTRFSAHPCKNNYVC